LTLQHELANNILFTTVLSRFFLVGLGPVEILQGDRYEQTLKHACRKFGYYYEPRPFVEMSNPARNQLLVHAARAHEFYEQRVLHEIDRQVFYEKPDRAWIPACSDPLILGLCIRSMSLQYRRYMLNYKKYGPRKFPP
jgi:hypothetical protein